MNVTYDVTKSFEFSSMQGVFEKVQKDFAIPIIGKKITYDTPKGKFIVTTNITDKRQYEVVLLTRKQMSKYQAPCGHEHDWGILSGQKGVANFCKSIMHVQFSKDFQDTELQQKLCTLMKNHNDVCAPGVTSVPPTHQAHYYGFITPEGKIFQFDTRNVNDKDLDTMKN